jgi:hypothetical protein
MVAMKINDMNVKLFDDDNLYMNICKHIYTDMCLGVNIGMYINISQ